jgi:hypothetical protein
MQINVIYDPSVANAPAGFTTAVTDAVNYLDKLFTNPISITIDVGYGEVDGFQLGSNALGESYYAVSEPETYSAVVSALKAENAPGASTLSGQDVRCLRARRDRVLPGRHIGQSRR